MIIDENVSSLEPELSPNARQFILTTDAERLVYLALLRHYCTLHRLSLVGYCLMSNHVHLIVIPKQLDSLAATLKNTHGRYTGYWRVTSDE